MLSEKNELILKRLLNLCKDGYKLIEKEDFPEIENIENSINYLCDREYLSLKYKSENTFLLKVMPRGKEYFQNREDLLLSQGIILRKSAVNSLIGGLIGSFTGGCLTTAIWYLIRWIYAK